MKKTFKLLFAALLTVALLVACGGTGDADENGNGNGDGNGDDEELKFKVVMVLDSGGIDDKSFNQSSWEGVQRFLEDNDLSDDHATYLSSKSDGSDYVPNLDKAATEGADLIIAVGFLFEDALEEVAPQHPDVEFLFIDGFVDDIDNIHNTSFAEHEGSYLVGLLAGKRAEEDGTNRVGFVGGIGGPVIYKFQAGYEQGVWEANPDATIDVAYADSFEDTSKGDSLATRMYNDGANVVFHAAGAVGNGVINAALNLDDKWVIGVDRDQYEDGVDDSGDSVILTSMIKRVDVAAYDFLQEFLDDGVISTDLFEFNMANDGINAELTEDRNVTPEEITWVEEYQEKIKSGDIEVSPDPVLDEQESSTKK